MGDTKMKDLRRNPSCCFVVVGQVASACSRQKQLAAVSNMYGRQRTLTARGAGAGVAAAEKMVVVSLLVRIFFCEVSSVALSCLEGRKVKLQTKINATAAAGLERGFVAKDCEAERARVSGEVQRVACRQEVESSCSWFKVMYRTGVLNSRVRGVYLKYVAVLCSTLLEQC